MHPAEEKHTEMNVQYCLLKASLYFKANQIKPCKSEAEIIFSEDHLAEKCIQLT